MINRQIPILAARLFLPDTPEVRLDQFTHRWTEILTRDVLDQQGNPVLRDDGENQFETYEQPQVIETFRSVATGFGDYLSLPRGDFSKVAQYMRPRYVDLRPVVPLGSPLEVAEHVLQDPRWPDQARMIREWAQHGQGIVKAETGAGKTLVGIGAVAAMGLATLILSKRRDAMPQWEAEFRRHTNIAALEMKSGQTLIGKLTPKHQYPVSFSTIQAFLSPGGWRRLIKLQNSFGLIIADEAHELGSPEFSRAMSNWNPLCWLGLTATPERKDQRHHIVYSIVGPVVSTGTADQMRPTVTFVPTGFKAPGWIYAKPYPGHFRWNKLLEFLSKDVDRQKLILDRVEQDIDDGRLVVVYAERRILIQALAKMLRQDGYKVAYADGGTKNRQVIYDAMRKRKYQVLCAGKILDALVNIPELDCLHLTTPVNQARQVKQIYGRTRRALEGKSIPLIRDYEDEGGQLSGAARNRMKVCKEEGWVIEHLTQPRQTTFDSWVPK
jgi:superfamily II DNA or RNA helicase